MVPPGAFTASDHRKTFDPDVGGRNPQRRIRAIGPVDESGTGFPERQGSPHRRLVGVVYGRELDSGALGCRIDQGLKPDKVRADRGPGERAKGGPGRDPGNGASVGASQQGHQALEPCRGVQLLPLPCGLLDNSSLGRYRHHVGLIDGKVQPMGAWHHQVASVTRRGANLVYTPAPFPACPEDHTGLDGRSREIGA